MAIHLSALLTTSSADIVRSSAVLRSQWSAMQRGVRAIVSESTATSIHLCAPLTAPCAAIAESSAELRSYCSVMQTGSKRTCIRVNRNVYTLKRTTFSTKRCNSGVKRGA